MRWFSRHDPQRRAPEPPAIPLNREGLCSIHQLAADPPDCWYPFLTPSLWILGYFFGSFVLEHAYMACSGVLSSWCEIFLEPTSILHLECRLPASSPGAPEAISPMWWNVRCPRTSIIHKATSLEIIYKSPLLWLLYRVVTMVTWPISYSTISLDFFAPRRTFDA